MINRVDIHFVANCIAFEEACQQIASLEGSNLKLVANSISKRVEEKLNAMSDRELLDAVRKVKKALKL